MITNRHTHAMLIPTPTTRAMIRKTFALYSREYELFVIEIPAKNTFALFRNYPNREQKEQNIRSEWVLYERGRILRKLDIPEVEIVQVKGSRGPDREVQYSLTTLDINVCDYYTVMYGNTFGRHAANANAKGCRIRHAIIRKGRTYKRVSEAFPTSYHEGIYSFFDNEEDYTLAKLMLAGGNIGWAYDEVLSLPSSINSMVG